MSWVVGIFIAMLLLAATGGAADPGAAPPRSSPAMTVPTDSSTTIPNPGFAPHCGAGPNDNDVRGVVRAISPTTLPPC